MRFYAIWMVLVWSIASHAITSRSRVSPPIRKAEMRFTLSEVVMPKIAHYRQPNQGDQDGETGWINLINPVPTPRTTIFSDR